MAPEQAASRREPTMAAPVAATLLAQAFRLASVVVLTGLVTRILGAEAFGLLTLALTVATVLSVVGALGIDQGTIYFVARAQAPMAPAAVTASATVGADGTGPFTVAGGPPVAAGADASAPSVIRAALVMTAAAGAATATLLYLLRGPLAAGVFDEPGLAPLLAIIAPTILLGVMGSAALGSLQGVFRVTRRSVLEFVLFPTLNLAFAGLALAAGYGIAGVAFAYLGAWVALAAISIAMALRIPGPAGPWPWRGLLQFSVPVMLSLVINYMLLNVAALMLGGLATARDVGIYGVAHRLALPLTVVVDSVNRALYPMIAYVYAHKGREELASTYATAVGWVMALNAPAVVLLALVADPLLDVFGPDFRAARAPLLVLCSGVIVASAFGAASPVLIMTRWRRVDLFDNVLALLLSVALNLFLIPRYGVLGAAIATAVTLASVLGLKVAQVRYLLGTQPFRFRQLATIGCALAAGLATRAAMTATGAAGLSQIAIALPLFAALYAGLWWRWGSDDESRRFVRTLAARLT